MDTIKNKFDKIMQERCKPNEMLGIIIACYKSEERMQDMINFILKNNLNCTHLWEDSEEGDKAYIDYSKIFDRSLLYDGIIVDEIINNN